MLSGVRDARVVAKASKDLRRSDDVELPAKAWRRSQRAFDKVYWKELKRFRSRENWRMAGRALEKAGKGWRKLDVKMKGWEAIRGGLNASYLQGQRACHAALTDPTPENFHAWRKRAKDLWYEARVLLPIMPDQMEAMAADLEKLSEALGDDHDLVILGAAAAYHGKLKDGRDTKFFEAIKRRHDELRKSAMERGGRFYAESAAAFTDRVEGYWHGWRKRKGGDRKGVVAG